MSRHRERQVVQAQQLQAQHRQNIAPGIRLNSVLNLFRNPRPNMFASTSGQRLVAESLNEWEAPNDSDPEHDFDVQQLSKCPLGLQPLIHCGMKAATDETEKDRELLELRFRELLRQAEHRDINGPVEDEDDEDLAEDYRRLGVDNSASDPEDIAEYFSKIPANKDYSPYPSKLLMMLDILDNLPRLRLSGNMFKMVLWILQESGVSDVPSYDAFRKMQNTLRELCGSEPVLSQSSLGNIFYSNNIQDTIARDLANPEVAKNLHFYPEEADGPVSEFWQFDKMKEFKPSELTPMMSQGLRQFYIEEVAQLKSEQYVIPHDWVIRNKVLTARCSKVAMDTQGWFVEPGDPVNVKADEFMHNYFDIANQHGRKIIWKEGESVSEMPNPLRKIAGDDDLYVVMVPLWCDDVSGNRSKQYNKHMNVYMVNGNLPGQLLQQEFNVHFVSASPHATAPEQFTELKKQVNSTHTHPIRCYNAHTKRPCSIILRVPMLPADNPQQSEEASHMGGNANKKCRKCGVGGNHECTESDEGYHALHFSGILRTAAETKKCLEEQLDTACLGVEKAVTDMQTATGVKDKISQHWIEILLPKARALKASQPRRSKEDIAVELRKWLDEQPGEKINPLLSIEGLDPTQDTPVEILHTILLGVVKYIWHTINLKWTDADRALFAIRLQSTDLSGLSVPPLRAGYMVQYRNNLIGKHFKTLMQTLAFAVHDLVSEPELDLINAMGALGALLWVHEIENLEEYLDDLEILVANVLDAFDAVVPNKIIVKLKLHVIVHIREDIKRFGPAIRYSTEVFECFNAIFRLCSVFSNHQAPSRDIAYKFASMDRLKHILSGGYWKKDGDWVQAGKNVLQVLHEMPVIQRHLGWVPKSIVKPGYVRTASEKKSPSITWQDTSASDYLATPPSTSPVWRRGLSIISENGDDCGAGTWVCYRYQNNSAFGRIEEIAVPLGQHSSAVITMEVFVLAKDPHEAYQLPFLRCPNEEIPDEILPRHHVIKGNDIHFKVSVQHDCRSGKCSPSGSRPRNQERQETTQIEKLIKHSDNKIYIINLHALHNATLLRKALGRELTRPKLLYENRQEFHSSIAVKLRKSQAVKRADTQKKRKATIEAKKKAKEAQNNEIREVELESEVEDEDEEEEEGEMEVDEEGPVPKRRRLDRTVSE